MEKVVLGHMDKQIVKNELLRTCREKYNFQIERIQKNEQSTDKNVYDIYCNKDIYIMKIYNNIEHTKSMVNLHNKLRLSKINVPKIITTKENENYTKILKEKYIVVYSFIEGEPIERNIQTGLIDKQTIISIAQVVKKIHKLTENKNEFNTIFEKYLKRDWIDVTTRSKEDVIKFIEKHKIFMAKPIDRWLWKRYRENKRRKLQFI